jgi:two-component system alkaline phosphatase synthesis response regulator PhoP
MRILLVEDEENLMEAIRLNLEMEGYAVDPVVTGTDALQKLRKEKYDLAVLDVMLPGIDGFTICETVRKEGNKTPVLFLTAKSAGTDRIKGLKIGGDDYLTKPFNLEELLLRVERLLQRTQTTPVESGLDEFRFGGNYVNFATYEIDSVNVGKKELTHKECQLLKLLVEKENQVVSRDEILDKVWGDDAQPSARTIDNFVVAFRKYFEKDPRNPEFFQSIRGVGYRFKNG